MKLLVIAAAMPVIAAGCRNVPRLRPAHANTANTSDDIARPNAIRLLALSPAHTAPASIVASQSESPKRRVNLNGLNRLLIVVMTCISRNVKDNMVLYSTGIEAAPRIKALFVVPAFLLVARRFSQSSQRQRLTYALLTSFVLFHLVIGTFVFPSIIQLLSLVKSKNILCSFLFSIIYGFLELWDFGFACALSQSIHSEYSNLVYGAGPIISGLIVSQSCIHYGISRPKDPYAYQDTLILLSRIVSILGGVLLATGRSEFPFVPRTPSMSTLFNNVPRIEFVLRRAADYLHMERSHVKAPVATEQREIAETPSSHLEPATLPDPLDNEMGQFGDSLNDGSLRDENHEEGDENRNEAESQLEDDELCLDQSTLSDEAFHSSSLVEEEVDTGQSPGPSMEDDGLLDSGRPMASPLSSSTAETRDLLRMRSPPMQPLLREIAVWKDSGSQWWWTCCPRPLGWRRAPAS